MSDPTEYTIGWICAVTTEYVAAQEFLDEEHPPLASQDANDNNIYTLGSIGQHKVAVACLPHWNYGLVSASSVARDMLRTFTNIRFGLMVGIGGGAPLPIARDIRLGDVVVSAVDYKEGAVFQYDAGHEVQGKDFKWTQHLDAPPLILQSAIQSIQARHERKGNGICEIIATVLARNPRLKIKYQQPDSTTDRLYEPDVVHVEMPGQSCSISCGLNDTVLVSRSPRNEYEDNPKVHYGLIASGNKVMKDAIVRDRLAGEKGVLCFETEAAGLMNHFKCLVIRGICDYSDSHKNEEWQGYAAMTAAAYAKDLLTMISPSKVEAEKRLTGILANVQEDIKQTRTRIEWLQESNHSKRIRDWLSPPDPSTNLNRALHLRHRETGRWFLEGEKYLTWKSKKNSFLWLNGIPGCGKTILSSTVIEDLNKGKALSSHVLYFYFDFSETGKRSLEHALRSLVYQIYTSTDIRDPVESLYSSHETWKRQPDIKSLRETFLKMINQCGDVWIVLDALDEREPNAADLLEWIHDLYLQPNIYILVTSRPEQDIHSAVENWASPTDIIPLRGSMIEDDIRGYIQDRMMNSKELERWRLRPEVREEIECGLIKKAAGMFRLAVCHLDMLEKCLTYQDVQRTLNDLPTTLNGTYDRIIDTIHPLYKDNMIRCLQFLTYSQRAVRIDELAEALAVDVGGQPPFDPKNRMPKPEEVVRYCSSLVLVDESTGGGNEKHHGFYKWSGIQLAHYSVKEYLTSNRLRGDIATHLLETNARTSIAQICLTYLIYLDTVLSSIQWGRENFQNLSIEFRDSYPMVSYAKNFGLTHAAIVEGTSKCVQGLIIELLSCENAASLCTNQPIDKLAPPLFNASFLGLAHTVKAMIENKNVDINYLGPNCGTALVGAILSGHEDVFYVLLEKGADINAASTRYGSPLAVAVLRGHKGMVKELLQRGADACGWGNRESLSNVVYYGYEDIFMMLLEKGADINATSEDRGFLLAMAALGGHKGMVKELLRRGADVCGCGNEVPLINAAYGGHEDIFMMLLEKGANINATSEDSGSPLAMAAWKGHKGMVKELLQRGADVRGDSHHVPLFHAARGGYEDMVNMLIDKEADVDTWGFWSTPLIAASGNGHEATVKTLLARGADVNARREGSTALLAAVREGRRETVRVLVGWMADVRVQHKDMTALTIAVEKGYQGIVEILLNAGADINARSPHGTGLIVGVRSGHKGVVKILIDRGADLNLQGPGHLSALSVATSSGDKDIVKMLLDAGADVNCHGEKYPAIILAAAGGYEGVVRMLLEGGADINARGRDNGADYSKTLRRLDVRNVTALMVAAKYGHGAVVATLISEGADVNMTSECEWSRKEVRLSQVTALWLAMQHEGIVKILKDAGAKCISPEGLAKCRKRPIACIN
ncbi:ankyrin repeat-containing domain protein [Hypomontagnella monticulosa]|nr:ankyrin repeat-containing domain protein [Hypomontagnella monticulosa]